MGNQASMSFNKLLSSVAIWPWKSGFILDQVMVCWILAKNHQCDPVAFTWVKKVSQKICKMQLNDICLKLRILWSYLPRGIIYICLYFHHIGEHIQKYKEINTAYLSCIITQLWFISHYIQHIKYDHQLGRQTTVPGNHAPSTWHTHMC